MRSRLRRSRVLGAEQIDGEKPARDSSLAAAEQEVARAESRAKAARARASQLRRQAEAGFSDKPAPVDDVEPEDAEPEAEDPDTKDSETEPAPARSRRWRPRRLHRPARKTLASGVGILLVCASLVASGYMIWQDRAITHKRQLATEFAAAARQEVVTLMSIDPQHAREDFQRIIDVCTGDFKAQMQARSGLMVKQAEESKVTSRATVEAVGVESVNDKSGVVLVSAKSDVTDPDNTKRPPMLWRLSVNIERDGGQLKISKLDFLQ